MKARSGKTEAVAALHGVPRAQVRAQVRAPQRPTLQLSLQFADPRHRALLPRHRVTRWIRAALQADAQITVRVVDADEGRRLNREFRGRDYATNVLTFDYERQPVIVADLVLCAPVLETEAKAAHSDLTAHYAHLVVHGTLHAQGHDHEHAAEARRMAARESTVLVGLGFDDPYAAARSQAPGRTPRRVR